ncbi:MULTISPECIES: putative T7SS-secreted protein [Actinomyces]|jgi:hypothetical protein|uniref:putative T7SS-secreted protein n=1 Tax=Actinomyces TaxID=1654 RepID=UPI00242C5563|nr:hypothetical protein [Actinomyces oris]
MSARPSDWSPLGQQKDPIPGDPLGVQAAARQYTETVEAIKTAQSSLQSISYESHGEAVAKLQSKAKHLVEQIGQAQSRCEGAAAALNTYAPHLENAQKISLEALKEAEGHAGQLKQVENQKKNIENAYNSSRNPEEMKSLRSSYANLLGQQSEIQGNINASKKKLKQAIEERDSAASNAISQLDKTDENSPMKDDFWDTVKEVLRVMAKVAELIEPVFDAFSEFVEGILPAVTEIAYAINPELGVAVSIAVPVTLTQMKGWIQRIQDISKVADGKMRPGEFIKRELNRTGELFKSLASGVTEIFNKGKGGGKNKKTPKTKPKNKPNHQTHNPQDPHRKNKNRSPEPNRSPKKQPHPIPGRKTPKSIPLTRLA